MFKLSLKQFLKYFSSSISKTYFKQVDFSFYLFPEKKLILYIHMWTNLSLLLWLLTLEAFFEFPCLTFSRMNDNSITFPYCDIGESYRIVVNTGKSETRKLKKAPSVRVHMPICLLARLGFRWSQITNPTNLSVWCYTCLKHCPLPYTPCTFCLIKI